MHFFTFYFYFLPGFHFIFSLLINNFPTFPKLFNICFQAVGDPREYWHLSWSYAEFYNFSRSKRSRWKQRNFLLTFSYQTSRKRAFNRWFSLSESCDTCAVAFACISHADRIRAIVDLLSWNFNEFKRKNSLLHRFAVRLLMGAAESVLCHWETLLIIYARVFSMHFPVSRRRCLSQQLVSPGCFIPVVRNFSY